MPCHPESLKKLDTMLDSIFKKDFEEAKHPRQQGGTFTVGEGEKAKEDTQEEPGNLGKKNAS